MHMCGYVRSVHLVALTFAATHSTLHHIDPGKKQSFAKSVFLWMPTVYSSLLLSLQRFLYGLSFCPNTSVSRVTTDSWGNDWWEQVTNCSSQTQANEVCLFMLEPAHFSLWNFIGIMLLSNLGKDMQVGHQKFVNGPRCFEINYACWVNWQTDDRACPETRQHVQTYMLWIVFGDLKFINSWSR